MSQIQTKGSSCNLEPKYAQHKHNFARKVPGSNPGWTIAFIIKAPYGTRTNCNPINGSKLRGIKRLNSYGLWSVIRENLQYIPVIYNFVSFFIHVHIVSVIVYRIYPIELKSFSLERMQWIITVSRFMSNTLCVTRSVVGLTRAYTG